MVQTLRYVPPYCVVAPLYVMFDWLYMTPDDICPIFCTIHSVDGGICYFLGTFGDTLNVP